MRNFLLIFSFFILSYLADSRFAAAQIPLKALDLEGDLTAWYDSQIGLENTELYTGSITTLEKRAKASHPFFESETWTPESISYRDQSFENIPLLYDLHRDLVLIRRISTSEVMQPIQHQVVNFTLKGKTFQYFNEPIGIHLPGFFQVIYEGEKLTLVAKRAKVIKIGGLAGESAYLQQDKYYLKKESTYYRISNRRSLLKLFSDEKKELRTFIRKNNLKIVRPGADDQLVRAIEYCEQLLDL